MADTATLTLTEFLLARLDEGDKAIRAVGWRPPYLGPLWLWRYLPTSWKRSAAAVYADHPDYNPDWS